MRRGSPVKITSPFSAHDVVGAPWSLLSQGRDAIWVFTGIAIESGKLNERTEASRLLIPTYEGLSGLGLEIRLPCDGGGVSAASQ